MLKPCYKRAAISCRAKPLNHLGPDHPSEAVVASAHTHCPQPLSRPYTLSLIALINNYSFKMISTPSASRSFSSLLALVLLIQPALAENWNPRVHVFRRDYVVPRTADRLPRPLKARADNTVQPGQPTHTTPDSSILGFEIIGETGVSGQQLFLGSETKVSSGTPPFQEPTPAPCPSP